MKTVEIKESLVEFPGLGGLNGMGSYFNELFDPTTGDRWYPILNSNSVVSEAMALRTEYGLEIARTLCRYLLTENEFAINAIENLISYVVGTGFAVRIAPMSEDPSEQDEATAEGAQEFLNEYLRLIKFNEICQETVRRAHRDGEVFIRQFACDSRCEFRFIEPYDITSQASPESMQDTWGIKTDPQDVNRILGYWERKNREFIPVAEMAHLKMNVDSNVKRGVPTFWPIRKNLHRAQMLVRNISKLATFQSSVLALRTHKVGTTESVTRFADDRAAFTVNNPMTGRNDRIGDELAPKIIDKTDFIEMTFPTMGTNIEGLIQALKAEIRAAAARLVFPEFMLASDASNSTYASTIVAEGPVMRQFIRLQVTKSTFLYDGVVKKGLQWGIERGYVPTNLFETCKVILDPPEVGSRDQLKEAQRNAIRAAAGVLSRRTWAKMDNLDYDVEKRNIQEEMDDIAPLDLEDPTRANAAGDSTERGTSNEHRT